MSNHKRWHYSPIARYEIRKSKALSSAWTWTLEDLTATNLHQKEESISEDFYNRSILHSAMDNESIHTEFCFLSQHHGKRHAD